MRFFNGWEVIGTCFFTFGPTKVPFNLISIVLSSETDVLPLQNNVKHKLIQNVV